MDGGSFTIKVTDVEVLLRVFTHLLSGTSAECSTTLRGRVSGSLLRDLKRFSFCVIPSCMRLENYDRKFPNQIRPEISGIHTTRTVRLSRLWLRREAPNIFLNLLDKSCAKHSFRKKKIRMQKADDTKPLTFPKKARCRKYCDVISGITGINHK
ncbi:hypothetical protein Bbelb_430960 [Branchiostoma belcheri]|nr:hypothetical protein Bbelb_430960 [Branchiostoma belcheri]